MNSCTISVFIISRSKKFHSLIISWMENIPFFSPNLLACVTKYSLFVLSYKKQTNYALLFHATYSLKDCYCISQTLLFLMEKLPSVSSFCYRNHSMLLNILLAVPYIFLDLCLLLLDLVKSFCTIYAHCVDQVTYTCSFSPLKSCNGSSRHHFPW